MVNLRFNLLKKLFMQERNALDKFWQWMSSRWGFKEF